VTAVIAVRIAGGPQVAAAKPGLERRSVPPESTFDRDAGGAMRAAMRFRMTVSISGTPATGTMGLGIANPL